MKAHALAFLEVVNAIFVQLRTLGENVILFVPFLQILFFPNKEKEKLEERLEIVRDTVSDLEKKQELGNVERNLLKKFKKIIEDGQNVEQEPVNVNQKMAVLRYCSIVWYRIGLFFTLKGIMDRIDDALKFPVVVDPKDWRPVTYQDMAVKTRATGREEDKEAIQTRIKEHSSNGTNVLIIPIVGISGVGKTTLAKVVLEDGENFDLKMFVRFPIKDEKKSSPENDMKQLVKEVIRAATKEESKESDWERLNEILREKLRRKRYLLVLDDVWIVKTDIRKWRRWEELQRQLMAGETGSLIIVTTRYRDCGHAVSNTGEPYMLRSLSEDNSWSLLEQLACKPGQMEKKPELKDVGKEILQKCGGNPLAITTVATLLSEKDTYPEWLDVKKQLSEPSEEDTDILATLRVCYAHLSPDLQKCFALCALFPKGSRIDKAALIQLWMAEEFIKSSGTRDFEDIGELYFKTLLNRIFFEDEERDAYGNITGCKMHDLMHDLAQKVAESECCSVVNDNADEIYERPSQEPVSEGQGISTSIVNARNLPTYLRTRPHEHESILMEDFDKFDSASKCLRVLGLAGSLTRPSMEDFDKFPSASKWLCILCFLCGESFSLDVVNFLGKLRNLRYLDLSQSDITMLSDSVCDLQKLQTLKLNYCTRLTQLPRDISKLASTLRHLENRKCNRLNGMPLGIGQLTSIQTLPLFALDTEGAGLSELGALNNLRGHLSITNLEKTGNATSESWRPYLEEKKCLQTLKLCWENDEGKGDENAALLKGLRPNRTLKGLHLWGYGGLAFPNWMLDIGTSLPYLVEIVLEDCPNCKFFRLFADLRHLTVLRLSVLNSLEYIDSNISDPPPPPPSSSSSSSSFKDYTPSGAAVLFPYLKEVYLRSLPKLKEWRSTVVVANDGKEKAEIVAEQPKHLSSPKNLSKLIIQNCPELTSIPFHPDVEELKLIEVSGALIQQSMAVAAPISPTTAATSSLPLPSFITLPKLKSLEISFCKDLESLPEGWLENLTSMECLVIKFCDNLKSLSGETHHPTSPGSRILTGKQLDSSRKDDNSNGFRNLRTLQLFELPKLTSLPERLQHARELKELSICFCGSLVTLLGSLENVRSHQSLAIRQCNKLTSLPRWMQQLTALLTPKISECPELNFSDEENDKPGLRSLRWMQLSHLPELVSLPGVLQHAKALENLEITSCPGLMSLPDWFGNLTSLRQINISYCDKLESLPEAMRGLSALQVLTISKCHYLTETCREEKGKDWPNISQIPRVFLDGKRLRSEESSSTSLPWK